MNIIDLYRVVGFDAQSRAIYYAALSGWKVMIYDLSIICFSLLCIGLVFDLLFNRGVRAKKTR